MPSSKRIADSKQRNLQSQSVKCRKISSFFSTENKNLEQNELGEVRDTPSLDSSSGPGGDSDQPVDQAHSSSTEPVISEQVIDPLQSPDSLYNGVKLSVKALTNRFPELECKTTEANGKKRIHITCIPCRDNIDIAKKYSRNGKVPIAEGVRADGTDRLKLIVNHMESEVHKQVLQFVKLQHA